jgi:hypothetical protein
LAINERLEVNPPVRSKVLLISLILGAIGIGAFGGHLLVSQTQQAPVAQEAKAAATPAPEATVAPVATPEPSVTPRPLAPGQAYVKFNQYGVYVTVTDPVLDLTYDMVGSKGSEYVSLSTRTLLAKYSDCLPSATNNALGQIIQKPHGQKLSWGVLFRQAGAYDYYYRAPSGSCADDRAGQNELAAARAAIKNAVLPTLTN